MDGKYSPLEHHLRGLPQSQKQVTLSFDQIEQILKAKLPPSAYQHRPWWGNEKKGSHVQASAWLDAGWQVETVSLSANWVRFTRS